MMARVSLFKQEINIKIVTIHFLLYYGVFFCFSPRANNPTSHVHSDKQGM